MKILQFLSLVTLVFVSNVQGQTLVLVHGLLGDGHSWREEGVVHQLQQDGWADGGNLWQFMDPNVSQEDKVLYTLSLPSEAPIEVQAGYLHQALQRIYQQRQEAIDLVGHSAGGIVARYYVLQKDAVEVSSLTTIATPNLGTPLAVLGKWFTQSPMAMMSDKIDRANPLMKQLVAENPGNFMFWLNHQQHPQMRYVSIIHAEENPKNPMTYGLEKAIPAKRQDLNQVAALRGQSEVIRLDVDHFLHWADGQALAEILRSPL